MAYTEATKKEIQQYVNEAYHALSEALYIFEKKPEGNTERLSALLQQAAQDLERARGRIREG